MPIKLCNDEGYCSCLFICSRHYFLTEFMCCDHRKPILATEKVIKEWKKTVKKRMQIFFFLRMQILK